MTWSTVSPYWPRTVNRVSAYGQNLMSADMGADLTWGRIARRYHAPTESAIRRRIDASWGAVTDGGVVRTRRGLTLVTWCASAQQVADAPLSSVGSMGSVVAEREPAHCRRVAE
jgi:hypothetical protein